MIPDSPFPATQYRPVRWDPYDAASLRMNHKFSASRVNALSVRAVLLNACNYSSKVCFQVPFQTLHGAIWQTKWLWSSWWHVNSTRWQTLPFSVGIRLRARETSLGRNDSSSDWFMLHSRRKILEPSCEAGLETVSESITRNTRVGGGEYFWYFTLEAIHPHVV